MDFSTYIVIKNECSLTNLQNATNTTNWGHWQSGPPTNIDATTSGTAQLKDSAGAATGSEGTLHYDFSGFDGGTIKFAFACPYGSSNNYFNVTNNSKYRFEIHAVSSQVKSNLGDWGESPTWPAEGNIPGGGHPLSVLIVIKDNKTT